MEKKAKSKTAKRNRKPAAPATPKNPDVTTYTIRDIPTSDWQEFKHKLAAKGHKVNWAMAEVIRKIGSGDITLSN